jgi:hypothetical protein
MSNFQKQPAVSNFYYKNFKDIIKELKEKYLFFLYLVINMF